MKKLIFMSSVSGVGKSTICNYIKDNNLLNNYSIYDIDDLENINNYTSDTYNIFYENAIKKALSIDDNNIILCSCINPNDINKLTIPKEIDIIENILIICSNEILEHRLKLRDINRNCSSDEYINSQIEYQKYMFNHLYMYNVYFDNSNIDIKDISCKIVTWINEPLELTDDNVLLKKGIIEDYKKVYEYDFNKLTNIWQDIEYVKNNDDVINNIYNEVKNKKYNWIIYYNNIPVGHILADRENNEINNSIELSYNLHPNYWGMGIMKKSIELLCNYLFQFYDNIVIGYCTGNDKSKKLLDKLDFKYFKTVKDAYIRNNISVDEYFYIKKRR